MDSLNSSQNFKGVGVFYKVVLRGMILGYILLKFVFIST